MKTILCFGDSNTYGYIPCGCGARFSAETRYPGRLRELLGPCYDVIEEGLNGRTTIFEDEFPGRRGIDYISPCVRSHMPIDVITIMLGTNDCKTRFHASIDDISFGMSQIIDAVNFAAASPIKILLIAPPHLGEKISESIWAMEFSPESLIKSKGLAAAYRALAVRKGCLFLDAAEIAHTGQDMAHMDAENHLILAAKLFETIKNNIA